MTPKERILAENQAEAARRLEDLKVPGADLVGDGNFTGIYEDGGELIIRTSTGEISMEDYEKLYGDPSKNWSAERKLEQIEAESRFQVMLEQQNLIHSSDEAQDQEREADQQLEAEQ